MKWEAIVAYAAEVKRNPNANHAHQLAEMIEDFHDRMRKGRLGLPASWRQVGIHLAGYEPATPNKNGGT